MKKYKTEYKTLDEVFGLMKNSVIKKKLSIAELKEKLDIAVEAINFAAEYLVCMDDLSEINGGKCNEQMALEELNKALAQIKGENA